MRPEGADELVFLDITASHEGRGIILDVVRRTAEVCFMPVTVGGGIRTLEDIRALLKRRGGQGLDQLVGCPRPWIRRERGEAVRAAGASWSTSTRNASSRMASRPGKSTSTAGGVPTGLEAVAWAREVEKLGAGEIVLTSMDADGTRNGYDLPMTRAVSDAVEIPVVASGGAGHPEHLRAAFAEGGASAALAASIFHYRQFTIAATKDYLHDHGIPVRRLVDPGHKSL